MRALLVNAICGEGSTGRICTDLAMTLAEAGHEVKIAYGRRSSIPDAYKKYAYRMASDKTVYLHALSARLFDNQGQCSLVDTNRFIRWIENYNPDIIHLHNIHGYYLHDGTLFDFLKDYNKPVIWTLHDAWAFTGHCVYFDYHACYKWKTGCANCPQKRTYPISLLLDRSSANYTRKRRQFTGVNNMTIVTPSIWLSECVKQSFLADYPVTVINNGIDTDVFQRRRSELRETYKIENKKVILGVSMGWAPHKHLDYFIRFADDLGDDCQVVVIGLNEEQKKKLPAHMIGFEKTKSIDELVEWYSTADVYVNPTMEDNYPTVNLEAQACGTPVVTFKSGGSAECIKEGFGIAVERGNYSELLCAVQEACNYKNSRKAPRIKGKRAFANDYMRLYDKILTKCDM